MAESIAEYLVGLGFKIDQASFNRFQGGLRDVAVSVAKMAAGVEAAAAGVIAGVRQIASVMDSLYFVAQRTGATAQGIQALGYAFSQMGLTADSAKSAVEGMAAALRASPGLKGLLSSLGVNPNQATEQIVKDFATKTANLPDYIAQQYGAMFGIDQNTLQVLRRGVGQFTAEYEDMAKRMGVSSKEAAESGNAFMTSWRSLTTVFDLLGQKVTQTLGKSLAGDLTRFKNFVLDNSKEISEVIEKFAKVILFAGEVVIRFAVRAKQFFDDLPPGFQSAIKWLAAFLVAWKAFNLAFMATPLGRVAGLLIALGTAIFLLYDDWKAFHTYGKEHALLDWEDIEGKARSLAAAFTDLARELGATAAWEKLKVQAREARDALIELFKELGKRIEETIGWSNIGSGLKVVLVAIEAMFRANADMTLTIFTGMVKAMTDLLKGEFKAAWEEVAKMGWKTLLSAGLPSNMIWKAMPDAWKKELEEQGKKLGLQGSTKPFEDWLKGLFTPSSFTGSPLESKPAIQLITYSQSVAGAVGGAVQRASMPSLPNASTSGTAPRGIRNNNPLNLSVAAGQEGLVGRDEQFGVYGTLQQGIASAAKQLLRYQDVSGLTTIAQIIEKWSPGRAPGNTPEKTASYIASVSQRMGVGPNQQINLHDPAIMRALIAAMGRIEVGREIDQNAIQQAVPGGGVVQGAPGGGGLVNALRGATAAMQNVALLQPQAPRSALYARPAGLDSGAGNGGGKTVNAPQTNTINITGVSDPQRAAVETERAMDRTNALLIRNLRVAAI